MARNKYPEETVRLILEEALKLFMEKGYENTSIQDIINHLGGLSKGAIYHHFKSKEEIFEAVCQKIGQENIVYYDQMRDDPGKNGYEKLKTLIQSAYTNPNNDAVLAMTDKIMSDPKFLMNQIHESYELVAPRYIEPIIREGIADGSIQTEYPAELAGVLITLLNIWINPMIEKMTSREIRKKVEFFDLLLKGIGIDIFDEEITAQYVHYCERYHQLKET
ncbi:MAG: TetR/AcrR family transcriptional regulator [Oscillibacter sp.]